MELQSVASPSGQAMQAGTNNPFDQRKANVLKDLMSGISDKSPKGSIDAPIVDMCNFINQLPDVYTTSSCSGRIVVFKDGALNKSGEWLVADHDFVTEHQVFDAIASVLPEDQLPLLNGFTSTTSSTSTTKQSTYIPIKSHSPHAINLEASTCNVHFRFEAFILAVETRTLDIASAFLTIAHQCGYRESGISAVAKRYIVNVRGSLRLDVPIILDSKLLVAPAYIQMLVQMGNEKMQRNFDKINRFYSMLKENTTALSVKGASLPLFPNSHTDAADMSRERATVTNTATPRTSVWSLLTSTATGSRQSIASGPVLLCVPRTHTKQWKDALKTANCFAKRGFVGQANKAELQKVLSDIYHISFTEYTVVPTIDADAAMIDTPTDPSASTPSIPVPALSSPISLTSPYYSLVPVHIPSQSTFLTLLDQLYNHSPQTQPLTTVDAANYAPLLFGKDLGVMMGVDSECMVLPEAVANAAVAATVAADAEAKARAGAKSTTGVVSEAAKDENGAVVNKSDVEHYSAVTPSAVTPLSTTLTSQAAVYCAVTLRRFTKALKDELQERGVFPKRGQVALLAEEAKAAVMAVVTGKEESRAEDFSGKWMEAFNSEACSALALLTTPIPSGKTQTLTDADQFKKSGFFELDTTSETKIPCVIISQQDLHTTAVSKAVLHNNSASTTMQQRPGDVLSTENPGSAPHSGNNDIFTGKNKPTTPHLQWAALITTSIASTTAPSAFSTAPAATASPSTAPATLSASAQLALFALIAESLPRRWELLGGCVLLPADSFTSRIWEKLLMNSDWVELNAKLHRKVESSAENSLPSEISLPSVISLASVCRHLCSVIGARVVAVQQPVHSDIMRASQAVVLFKAENTQDDELVERVVKAGKNAKADSPQQLTQGSHHGLPEKEINETGNNDMETPVVNSGSKKRVRTSTPQVRRARQDLQFVDPSLLVGPTTVTKDGCWVKHRENGLWYVLDVTKSMFSSGNTTEKARAAKYSQTYPCIREPSASSSSSSSIDPAATENSAFYGERVLDLYSGIGYFTLPMSTHGGASHVFACELNPYSNTALLHAATLNDAFHMRSSNTKPGKSNDASEKDFQMVDTDNSDPAVQLSVRQRITLLPGDNRRACVPLLTRNSVDRVSLGLIPDATDGWATALIALQPQGGFLHVHANINQGKEREWAENTLIPGLDNRVQVLSHITGLDITQLKDKSLPGVDFNTGKNEKGEHVLNLRELTDLVNDHAAPGRDADAVTQMVLQDLTIPCSATKPCRIHVKTLKASALPQSDAGNESIMLDEDTEFAGDEEYAHVPVGEGPLWDVRKNDWEFTLLHVEVVKSYGPRISHVVIDIGVQEKVKEGSR